MYPKRMREHARVGPRDREAKGGEHARTLARLRGTRVCVRERIRVRVTKREGSEEQTEYADTERRLA